MKLDDLIIRCNQLITLGYKVSQTNYQNNSGGGLLARSFVPADTRVLVKEGDMKGFRSAGLSFIENVYGKDHSHYTEFDKNTGNHQAKDALCGIAILEAIKDEISGGWLFSIKSLVSAEIFSDFIEMSEHLLEQGYKDPSAVMAGSVLEEHLRQLATKNGIDIATEKDGKLIPKKADGLNSDLGNKQVYTKLDQKLITAWLDLRNRSAHGKYTEYNHDQVGQMIQGITGFIARTPV